ncbi:hypothetical protein DRO34_02655 [Candidatus Bathyarchaeota archaeon]|nr:MAG: hypothetical protein DRO34_02655 [Candidatus Bathyarchaeota archaeon]
MNRREVERILRKVPREKAFYFFTSIGNYTGESAASLGEFVEKLKTVNSKSLEFHLHRGDFEKWVADTLEDKELAEEIGVLRRVPSLMGENLRRKLHFIVSRRHDQLKSLF